MPEAEEVDIQIDMNDCRIDVMRASQLVKGQADPVVRHPSLGEIVGADLLRTVAGSDLAAALLSLRVHFLQILLLPKDPNDDKNIILEIRAV